MMEKNKALLLLNILLITATTSQLTLASGGTGGANTGPTLGKMLADEKGAHEHDDSEIDDLQGTAPTKGSPEWLRLRVEKLEGQLAAARSVQSSSTDLYNIDQAIKAFTKNGEPSDEQAKFAYKAALQALHEKKALARIHPDFFKHEGAQRAAAERGYDNAMPLAEKLRKIREKAELSRATRNAGGMNPEDIEFLKGQLNLQAQLDAHYQRALSDATPFHRELRTAVKEGFVGGIANGVGQATGTYLVRAIDWFWNGVYYNISSNRKRRDAQIEAAMHEENVLNQRSFLNNNSKMLNNAAKTAEVTKRVLKDDIAGLEAANIGVKKLLSLTSRAEKEVEARAEFEDAIEDCKKEQMKLSGEIKVLSESKDNKKLSEALKREKELGQEIASLEAMKKAAQLKVDAQLAPLVEELNEEDFASHIQFVQNQMKILIAQKDELISIKTEIASKSKSLSPADMKKANDDLAEINKSLKEGEETFKMFKQQLTLCAELSMPGASRNLLNEPMNISLLEMLLMQINLAKRVEIKALKDQSLTISKDLVSRLTSHNKKFATLDKRDESDLAASIEYFEGLSNKSSPEKSAA